MQKKTFVQVVVILVLSVACNGDDMIWIISEKGAFKSVLDAKNESTAFLQINANQNLNQFIEGVLKPVSTRFENGKDNMFIFNDLSKRKNEMIKEVLEYDSRITVNKNITVYLDDAFRSNLQV